MTAPVCRKLETESPGITLRCCRASGHDNDCCGHFSRMVTGKPGVLVTGSGQLVACARSGIPL